MTTEEKDAPSAPAPIPTPPEFPVRWERPEDEGLLWNQDRMHWPEPAPPMQDLFNVCFNAGAKQACEFFKFPIALRTMRINTYYYMAMAPRVPPDQVEEAGQEAAEEIGEAMGRLQEWWEGELLPEVQEHLAFWEGFDLAGASMPELLAHLEETETRLTRLWYIHFQVGFPFIAAPGLFADLYEDLFPDTGALGAFKLLQGFGNKTIDGGHALWELSRKALQDPGIKEIFEQHTAQEIPAKLQESEAGKALLADLQQYLEEYGQRSDRFADLSSAGWIENPTTAIQNMKNFMAEADRDMPSELQELAKEREDLVAQAREALEGYPEAVRGQFEFLLRAAQAGTIIQEDHNYWIDQRSSWKVRQVVLEFGKRFAEAGIIDDPEDVFMVTPEELRATAKSMTGDLRPSVQANRDEIAHFAAMRPVETVGTPPPGPPPDNPLMRAFGRFSGGPPAPSEDPSILNGNPCSPGKATGTAKVVMSLAEADKLEPGDIMIAPATMPAWTPLFASVKAVVTDAGGVLSHAGIVAREYNIPAVLGTGQATSVIKDGQQVEVDGDEGVVRILS